MQESYTLPANLSRPPNHPTEVDYANAKPSLGAVSGTAI